MKQLQNINHTFDVEVGDIGVTIRKGSKWATVATLGKELDLELWNCPKPHPGECTKESCKLEGTGYIIGYWSGILAKLPKALLSIEHNLRARNMDVLKKMLTTAYGSIGDNDIVTALIYQRISNEQQ